MKETALMILLSPLEQPGIVVGAMEPAPGVALIILLFIITAIWAIPCIIGITAAGVFTDMGLHAKFEKRAARKREGHRLPLSSQSGEPKDAADS